ncbi:MAG TPA: hypothetical protein PKC43_05650 [Phycisphaerales bacterium]|nr:hypothetical protein [Phycisphaerales bacterium]HMP36916.1 hypothetical protein [Phycisphaerales bacterium]
MDAAVEARPTLDGTLAGIVTAAPLLRAVRDPACGAAIVALDHAQSAPQLIRNSPMPITSNLPSLVRPASAFLLALVPAALLCAGGDCEPEWDTTLGSPGMSSGYVASIAVHDDGSGAGPQLYATGNFASAGGNPGTALIARWNGAQWVSVGGGLVSQFSNVLQSWNGGLYVGGYFDSAAGVPGTAKLARWNGSAWQSVGAQLESFLSAVWSFAVWDDGSGEALYVGGNYLNIGGQGIDHIAKFNGTTFSPVGGTIVGPAQIVLDMRVFNDELIICGRFQSVGGVPAANIARWNGAAWQPLGGGLPGTQVICLEVIDGQLYAGGSFLPAAGSPATRIARWDGAQWHPLGPGLNNSVQDIAGYDDGTGMKVYAVGNFTATGDNLVPLNRIARWTGAAWEPFGNGLGATENIFESFVWNDGESDRLLIGGSFPSIDGLPSSRVAAWVGCVPEGILGDLDGNGIVDGADLGLLLGAWGDRGPADLDGNGVVDGADLGILLGNWS